MQRHLRLVLVALAIAAVWGYFSDLRNGQIEWFILRLALCTGIILIWSLITQRKA